MRNAHKKITRQKGVLYGIGIGPGDPELLTLKAKKILQMVDVIFAPSSGVKSGSMAADIIKRYVNRNKIKTIVFPMTKDKRKLHKFWRRAAIKVYRTISSGKNAAFVTIGDPFIYSTYTYLLRCLRMLDKDVEVKTIPGISALNASASLLEIPLAEADEKFAVIPLPKRLEELRPFFGLFDTIILFKIGKDLSKVVQFLKKEGLYASSYFARRIGCPEQYAAKDLSQLKENKKTSGYLSTMIVKTKKAVKRGLK